MKRFMALSLMTLFAAAAIVAVGVRVWLGPPNARIATAAELSTPPGWTPIDWPFLNDQFGKGKAFECAASDCGAVIRLTFRAKIGFCNCATGVSDDDELERIGDVGMAGATPAPLGEGREIKVGRMAGRSRPYALGARDAKQRILSLAFNDRCDVIVATAQAPNTTPLAIEPKVLDFLNSEYVLHWAQVTLGL